MAAAVGGALLGLLLAGRLSLRLRRAASIAERVTAGELDARIHARGHDEVAKLGEAIDRMAEAMRAADRARAAVRGGRRPRPAHAADRVEDGGQPARPRPGRRRHPRAGRPAAAAGRGSARDLPARQRHGHRRPALGRPGRLRRRAWSATRRGRPSARTARRSSLVDPRRLERVIENVLDNAARHGAPPVEVSVSARPDRDARPRPGVQRGDAGAARPSGSPPAIPPAATGSAWASPSRPASATCWAPSCSWPTIPAGGAVVTIALPPGMRTRSRSA